MAPLALIVAPFWRQPHHLGNRRIDRYRRWLVDAGWEVVLVRAGTAPGERVLPWGRELTVRDPLGLHPDPDRCAANSLRRREYHPLTRCAAFLAFNPDPGIAWARQVGADPRARAEAGRARLILASSPPESAHLAALELAGRSGAGRLVDMRDGWLDEPLKPALARWRLQRWREGRLERRVLEGAGGILVSSPQWRDLLLGRFPHLAERVAILPNCYPADGTPPRRDLPPPAGELRLLHAGQFTGSKYNNRPELLLGPLLAGLRTFAGSARTILRGRFTRLDLREIEPWRGLFAAAGHQLELLPPIEGEALRADLAQAHGLLLLSATRASLPAKVFDYLPTLRPILAVTPEGSAVWRLAAEVPQLFLLPPADPAGTPAVAAFLAACRSGATGAALPARFHEDNCRRIFYAALERLAPAAGPAGSGPSPRPLPYPA